MIPEVFECPRCERQFVIDGVPDNGSEEVHCPQCSRFLGVRDIAFVLRTELDELIERLDFEKDRLEKDEAILNWVNDNSTKHSPEEVEHWNEAMISRHPDTAAKKARFLHFLKEAGGDGRKDIRTYFDLIEFDEGRLK